MKKRLSVFIINLIVFIICLTICVQFWQSLVINISALHEFENNNFYEASIKVINESIQRMIPNLILSSISTIGSLFLTIITLKDLPVFKPVMDKLNARKEERAAAKAERAEADKQQRITELEEELQQLKNDD